MIINYIDEMTGEVFRKSRDTHDTAVLEFIAKANKHGIVMEMHLSSDMFNIFIRRQPFVLL